MFPVCCFPPVLHPRLTPPHTHLSHICLVSTFSPAASHPLGSLDCISVCVSLVHLFSSTPRLCLFSSPRVLPVLPICSTWFSGLSFTSVLLCYIPLPAFVLPVFFCFFWLSALLLLAVWTLTVGIEAVIKYDVPGTTATK